MADGTGDEASLLDLADAMDGELRLEDYELDGDSDSEFHPPAWACVYCGISDPMSVIRCVESGRWVCNSRGITAHSHAVQHLVRGRRKQVSLHEASPLGDAVLECYNCQALNVFTLGFIASMEDNVVVLLCRECLGLGALKDSGWDLDQWMPLIEDGAFVSWLVNEPSEEEQLRARQVTTGQIARMEELWKAEPDATFEDLERPSAEDDIPPVPLRFEDGYQYQNMLAPLVQIEAECDRRAREGQRRDNISLRWELTGGGSNRRAVAVMRMSTEDLEARIVPGDSVVLSLGGGASLLAGRDWSSPGTVLRAADGEVAVEVSKKGSAPLSATEGYAMELVWRSTSFDRKQAALKTFAADDRSVSGYLYHRLLGHDVEEQVLRVAVPARCSAPGLPELNDSQHQAVRDVLQRPLSLIQGPPGTGKTVTSATLVYHLAKQGQGQVLVAAPSNVACDQLTERIHRTGLRVVRLCAKSRETLETSVLHLSAHAMVEQLAERAAAKAAAAAAGGGGGGPRRRTPRQRELDELGKLQLLRGETGELRENDQKRYKWLQRKFEVELLQNADVVCTTAIGVGDSRLRKLRFVKVLVDEATQATEPETMVAIAKGAKQLVLVGDHCQLGPITVSSAARRAGLGRSMFERLVRLGVRPIRLDVQYRMHPMLSAFPSDNFYEGSLRNGVTEDERRHTGRAFPWPRGTMPMLFVHAAGGEEMSGSGTSFLNRGEASLVEKCVTLLLQQGVLPESVGVVTPYAGQRAYVAAHMQRCGPLQRSAYAAVEVASVDAFQGREKDYIVLSCVRSNESTGIGFLGDARRLNVALTRARLGVVIFGNTKVLAKDALWYDLIRYYQEEGCLMSGPLNNLVPCVLRYPPPKRGRRRGELPPPRHGRDDADYSRGPAPQGGPDPSQLPPPPAAFDQASEAGSVQGDPMYRLVGALGWGAGGPLPAEARSTTGESLISQDLR